MPSSSAASTISTRASPARPPSAPSPARAWRRPSRAWAGTPSPASRDNDALLRRSLLGALGQLRRPGGRRRGATPLRGLARRPRQPDAAPAARPCWRSSPTTPTPRPGTSSTPWPRRPPTPPTRRRLYRYLGTSRDPALADRALALALTKEPPADRRAGADRGRREDLPGQGLRLRHRPSRRRWTP